MIKITIKAVFVNLYFKLPFKKIKNAEQLKITIAAPIVWENAANPEKIPRSKKDNESFFSTA